MYGDFCFGVHCVDLKAVACVDYLFVSQVNDYYLVVYLSNAFKLRFELLGLLKVQIDSLLDVGQFKDPLYL